MIPEERAAEVINSLNETTSTDDLRYLIADAIRNAVKEDRAKAGRTYHIRKGETVVVVCWACRGTGTGDRAQPCAQCGGMTRLRIPHGGNVSISVMRPDKEEVTPEQILAGAEDVSDEMRPMMLELLRKQELETRDYCASLLDSLGKRFLEHECYDSLDDDEYSRQSFASALSSYAGYMRQKRLLYKRE